MVWNRECRQKLRSPLLIAGSYSRKHILKQRFESVGGFRIGRTNRCGLRCRGSILRKSAKAAEKKNRADASAAQKTN